MKTTLQLFGLAVILLTLSACGAQMSQEDIRAAAVALLTEEAGTQAALQPPTNTPKPTNTERPTSKPEPTRTPIPSFGSRSQPVPIRTNIGLVYDGALEFDISVDQVITGEDAWQMVRSANSFNDPPIEGYEYVCIYITVTYTDGPDDRVLELNEYDFEIVSSGEVFDAFDSFVVSPKPEFDAQLFPGGSTSGWIVLTAKAGDTQPLLVIGRSSSSPGFFLALYE